MIAATRRGDDPDQRPLNLLPTRCDAVSTGAWLWLTSPSDPEGWVSEGVSITP
jgi:hypothetical protein